MIQNKLIRAHGSTLIRQYFGLKASFLQQLDKAAGLNTRFSTLNPQNLVAIFQIEVGPVTLKILMNLSHEAEGMTPGPHVGSENFYHNGKRA